MLFNYIIKDAENITPPKSKAVNFKEYQTLKDNFWKSYKEYKNESNKEKSKL